MIADGGSPTGKGAEVQHEVSPPAEEEVVRAVEGGGGGGGRGVGLAVGLQGVLDLLYISKVCLFVDK